MTCRSFASTGVKAKKKTRSWFEQQPVGPERLETLKQRNEEKDLYLLAVQEEENRMVGVRPIISQFFREAKESGTLDSLPTITPRADHRVEVRARTRDGVDGGVEKRKGEQKRADPVVNSSPLMRYGLERDFMEKKEGARGWGLRGSSQEEAPVDRDEQLRNYHLVPPWADWGSERQTRVLDVAGWMKGRADKAFPDFTRFILAKYEHGILLTHLSTSRLVLILTEG